MMNEASPAALMHVIVLALWGGVVLAESVLELYPRGRPEAQTAVIGMHYRIDVFIELPLILLALLTGLWMMVLHWPLSGLHWIKIALALVAVSANLACIVLVIRRQRAWQSGMDAAGLDKLTRWVFGTAMTGMPCAMVAVLLGFYLALVRVSAEG